VNDFLVIRLPHSPAFAAQSHGWCYLAPFDIDGDRLDWAVRLPKGGARRVSIRWSGRSDVVRVEIPGRKIAVADRDFLRSRVRWMFRADEDFGEFWELCRGHAILRHCRLKRTGALLRCATVFEDVVKTICTTNCSWWNTKTMVANLCRTFGELCPGDGDAFTFPTPERLAAVSLDDMKVAKLGFRARYILEVSQRVAGGDLDLDAWCRETDPVALRSSLLGVMGVGSYAANHLLMLLGHYGEIPCDSEVREYLGVSPKAAQKEVEQAAAERYGHWGKYCFLAYKFERVFKRLNYVDWRDWKRR
jgi:3-methyladenine DNA glycosylase/8-oxoguanine DNA glycosylase